MSSAEDALERYATEALSELLGSSGSQAIVFHLGGRPTLRNLQTLHARLLGIFGDAGAESVERKILIRMAEARGRRLALEPGGSFDFVKQGKEILQEIST